MGGDIDKQYMMLQTIVAIITFPFIVFIEKIAVSHSFRMHLEEVLQKKDKKQNCKWCVVFLWCYGGIMMNNVMAFYALEEKSIAYQEVTTAFRRWSPV